MIKKLETHLHVNFPFLKGKKILVACSGGVDSVVLSYLLKHLHYSISLVHCNFLLRGKESDAEEEFVIDLADKLSVPIFTKTFKTKAYAQSNKISTQMAARDLRYLWFQELLDKHPFNYITTGHHLDDDAETFLINLSRGTGLRGLLGIPEINETIIRPLLVFSREDILHFANKNNIIWKEDSSNKSLTYTRNKFRLKVIPAIKEQNHSFLQNFKQTQKNLIQSQSLVDDYMLLIKKLIVSNLDNDTTISIQKLKELPHSKAILYELLAPYGFSAWKDILDLLDAQTGKQIFSKTHRLIKHRDVLILSEVAMQIKNVFSINESIKNISEPISLKLEKVDEIQEGNENTIFVDYEKLHFPIQLRKWQKGDVFFPFGMKGKKKLSKFFKDEKLSLVDKEKVWLLISNNEIIWVIGKRLDNRFRVTQHTKKILKIVN